jgi:uncharacterized protein YndB with AHSA1/START domain
VKASRIAVIVFLVLAFATAIASGAPAVKSGKDLSPEQIAKLNAGEALLFDDDLLDAEGKPTGEGVVIAKINRPPKEVWKHLTAYEAYPEFMPNVRKLKINFREGNKVGLAFEIKVLFMKLKYSVIRVEDPKKFTVDWSLDKTKESDIKDTSGTWKIEPYGENESLLIYIVKADPGMAMPKKVQIYLVKKAMPNTPLAVKKRVESGGTYKRE